MAKAGKPLSGDTDGIHIMPSGLMHCADSLMDGPRGRFVDHFGPPGDPTKKATRLTNGDAIGAGRAPDLLKTMQANRQRSNARS